MAVRTTPTPRRQPQRQVGMLENGKNLCSKESSGGSGRRKRYTDTTQWRV